MQNRCNGANRRIPTKGSAWKSKATELAPSPRVTESWTTRLAPIGGANSSGSTKRDSMQRDCWRTIQNGNPLLLSTKNWSHPAAAGQKRQRRGSNVCVWSILSGRLDAAHLRVASHPYHDGRTDRFFVLKPL